MSRDGVYARLRSGAFRHGIRTGDVSASAFIFLLEIRPAAELGDGSEVVPFSVSQTDRKDSCREEEGSLGARLDRRRAEDTPSDVASQPAAVDAIAPPDKVGMGSAFQQLRRDGIYALEQTRSTRSLLNQSHNRRSTVDQVRFRRVESI